jgi:hypothetical protein
MKVGSIRLLSIVVLVCLAAAAQTWRGTLTGTVSDGVRKGIPRAAVLLTNQETGRARAALTNSQGDFSISLLTPGAYTLEVELEGYRKHVQSLSLAVNQEVHVDVALLPGQVNEQIVVAAAAELLKTDSASVSTVVGNHLIRNLPLDGRNFYELTLLVPGTLPPAPGSAGSVRGAFAINVNGAREDANNFLLDGAYSGDPKLNGIGVTPSVDAIREFEVLTSTYDASFGRNGGGHINAVLRSGSNDVHGAVFEFFRNEALDARNHFARGQDGAPRYQRNQFGASLGGPLRKDRTFLFGDYEGRRVREAITRITNVPTLLERQGDFSQSARPPADLFTRQPFPGNRIPEQRIHPVGRALAALYPLPNRDVPGENFISSPVLRDRSDNFDLRMDHHVAPRSELALRYSFGDGSLFDPFSGPGFARVPGFGTNIPRRAQNVMASETQIFKPTLIAEFRGVYNRVALGSFHQNQGRSLNREAGLPELSSNPRDFGLSFISLPGFSPLGDEYNNPQDGTSETWQGQAHASWAHGKGVLKFGGEFRSLRQSAYRDVLSRGLISFLGISGNPLGDLLQGFPTFTAGARLDNHQNLRSRGYAAYVHDSYRIGRDVVLSAGIRYEYSVPPFDANGRATAYDPLRGTLVPVGTDGFPRSGYYPDRNNFGPRLGLAWSPRDSGTVVRAGYGIYYDQFPLAPSEGLYFSAPYFDSKTYFPFDGYPITLSDPFPADYPIPVPSTALAFQRDLRTTYLQHWSFSVQQQIGSARTLEIGYVGSKGTKLLTARDINQPRPTPVTPNPRPNPGFDDINILESRGNSVYHSLQTRFQQQIHRGLSVLASHTWGKSIDDGSNFFSSAGDPNFPQDSLNTSAERGRSSFDLRQRLSLSYSYDLPLGRGRLLGGWRTNGIWTFQSGRPFTVALIPDLDNSNTGRSTLGFGANDRPNVTGNPKLSRPSPARWFNTAAFEIPPRGHFGNSGRNILEGPGLQNLNVSVVKDTWLREDVSLQFRAEAFNLLNRTNYDLPDIFLGSPTFGRILSAGSPRHVQFGFKLLF